MEHTTSHRTSLDPSAPYGVWSDPRNGKNRVSAALLLPSGLGEHDEVILTILMVNDIVCVTVRWQPAMKTYFLLHKRFIMGSNSISVEHLRIKTLATEL